MGEQYDLSTVPDDDLLERLSDLVRQSREIEADLIAHLGEVDARQLYLRPGAGTKARPQGS